MVAGVQTCAFFFSSRRRHTRSDRDWSSDVCSSDLRQPLNDEISSKFLDRYIETLDGLHLHFLKSDLEEFDQYRTVLDDLTLAGKTGDRKSTRLNSSHDQISYAVFCLKKKKTKTKNTTSWPARVAPTTAMTGSSANNRAIHKSLPRPV